MESFDNFTRFFLKVSSCVADSNLYPFLANQSYNNKVIFEILNYDNYIIGNLSKNYN